jgi:hypothetical protein
VDEVDDQHHDSVPAIAGPGQIGQLSRPKVDRDKCRLFSHRSSLCHVWSASPGDDKLAQQENSGEENKLTGSENSDDRQVLHGFCLALGSRRAIIRQLTTGASCGVFPQLTSERQLRLWWRSSLPVGAVVSAGEHRPRVRMAQACAVTADGSLPGQGRCRRQFSNGLVGKAVNSMEIGKGRGSLPEREYGSQAQSGLFGLIQALRA